MNKQQQYAIDIYQSLVALFDEDEENFKYNIKDVDLTKFCTAYILAFAILYENVTGDKEDLIGIIAIMNRLVFQKLLKDKSEVE